MTRTAKLATGGAAVLVLAGAAWWAWGWWASRPVDLARLTTAQWRDDLQYLARELAARHRNAFHRVSRADYDRLVARIDSALPGLDASAVPVYFEMLTAAVGDAHTFVSLPGGQHFFPFGVFYFGDGPRVVRTTPALRGLLGLRLVRIGTLTMPEVEARLDEILTQGENAWYYRAHYPGFLSTEVLHALGVITRTDSVTFTFAGGGDTSVTRTLAPGDAAPGEWIRPYAEAPLYVRHGDDDFWFETLPGTHTIYVVWNSYRGLHANAARLFDAADRERADRLIVDLRGNGGGDYLEGHAAMIAPILARPALDRPGHLYVITGRFTFSAAMSNAAQFRTETRAILVGEPPGEVPNSYQERRSFRLPHSHLLVNYSVRYYRFLPADVPALTPDEPAPPDWEDYRAGRDPALIRILADSVPRP